MSTDIRSQKKAIADALLAAQSAQGTANTAVTRSNIAQAAADAAATIGNTAKAAADAAAAAVQVVTGTVQTISMDMVRKFTSEPIEAAAFVLDAVSGYYYATVSHLLGDAAPDVEVYDNDKDKQAVQSILVDNNTIKLELSAADMASNSFPFKCICLGKTEPAPLGVGLAGEPIPGRNEVVRYNSINGGTVEYGPDGGNDWFSIDGVVNVLEAYLGTDAYVHIALRDGVTFQTIIPGTWEYQPSNAAAYAAATDVSMGAVFLGTYEAQ